jgi:pimeloyl-ACP methyl ester carboxylesterase
MRTRNPSSDKPARLPILLIHGLAASRHDWSYLDPALTAAGYPTYSLDLLGHGDGYRPKNVDNYHFECLQQDFIAWVDSLNLESPPVLVGHSLGGYLALDYALHAGRPISGLLLIAPFYSRRQLPLLMRLFYRLPIFGALGMRLAPQWLIQFGIDMDPIDGQFLSSRTRRQMAVDTKRASPQIYYLPRSFPDLTPELSKINASSLVIWGENDHTLNPDSFPVLVDAIPKARGYPVPIIGHQPHLGKSEIVNMLALEFLNNIPYTPIKPQGLPVAMD